MFHDVRFLGGLALRACKCLTFATVALSSVCSAVAEPIRVIPGRYIIQRHQNVDMVGPKGASATFQAVHSSDFFDVVIPNSAKAAFAASNGSAQDIDWTQVEADCDEIRRDPTVRTCEPDVVVPMSVTPNDPKFSSLWGMHDSVSNNDVNLVEAWQWGTGKRSTVLGIIDSGIYYSHNDLTPNLWINPGEGTTLDGIDNDGNGWVDDIIGIHGDKKNNDPIDCNGHGTHVAGTMGAVGNNRNGVVGVNWTTSLATVAVGLPDCSRFLSSSGILIGYDYFHKMKQQGHNIVAINASYGGEVYVQAEYEAVARLNNVGVLLVAAAMNSSKNIDTTPQYPASFNLPNVIAVGATGPTLRATGYTNYGNSVDIAAPGGDVSVPNGGILSTFIPIGSDKNAYKSFQGTSMAAPMVTGAIGLLASQQEWMSGPELKQTLLETATRVEALKPFVNEGRFLNVLAMVKRYGAPDNCPSDPNKLQPGVCGCGRVEDARDADLDGRLNCFDGCPTDPRKTTPGVCGCGIPDTDGNGNGAIDCKEIGLGNIVPPAPTVSIEGRYLYVSAQPRDGIEYFIEFQVRTPVKKGSNKKGVLKRKYYVAKSSRFFLRKPKKGAVAGVRYAFRTLGTQSDFSYWSPWRKLKVRK